MSEFFKVVPEHDLYFLTGTIIDWIDVFSRKDYCQTIYDSWKYCIQEKGLRIHAFVIMSNHFHLIASSEGIPLNRVIQAFKAYSAKKLMEAIANHPGESRRKWLLESFSKAGVETHRPNRVWQGGSKYIALFNSKQIRNCLKYVHNNPVKAGIVDTPESYIHSSARAYVLGEKPPVRIDFLEI